MNGIPTPTSTPPPSEEKQLANKLARSRLSDGASSGEPSPKVLPTDPIGASVVEESLEDRAATKALQEEDKDSDSEEREGDIYAQKVLQCKFSLSFHSLRLN